MMCPFYWKFSLVREIYAWKSQHACLDGDDLHLQSMEFVLCLSTACKDENIYIKKKKT